MKRVLAFASALALAVGAIAPAAFADDYVPAQIPLTDIYSDPELYELYVAPYYNNLSFSDWDNYATDAVISGFPMDVVKQVETTEGGLESLWNTVHNAFQFGYNIGQDWVSKLYVDTNDGRLKSNGNIMTDDLKALLDQYFKSTPSSNIWNASHGSWVSTPVSGVYNGYSGYLTIWRSGVYYDNMSVYITRLSNGLFCYASYITDSNDWYLSFKRDSGGGNSLGYVSIYPGYSIDGHRYATGTYNDWFDIGITAQSFYTSPSIAWDDFYNSVLSGGGVADWNGDGYYRDEYNVDIALPAIPAIDWKDLNNKYYTDYGGDFVDGDVNNFYYDISYNYFPAEYTYTIPYWLIDGNSTVLDFDYSLELPSVDLYELPSEFSGGEEVWDSSFTMLGGFGAFILLGFSFGLVALFFKD